VEFGSPGFDHIPISKAVLASASLPGVFPPVVINDHSYVDGALKKTLHASVALDTGVPLLFCFNPIVPLDISKSNGKTRRLTDAGLPGVMAQTLRSLIHSRMAVGMGRYANAYPNTDIVLFEPDHGDDEIFFVNILATAGRQRLCEHAYRSTRSQLWRRRQELAPILARHGFTLNVAVLEDEHRSLMHTIVKPRASLAGLTQITAQLSAQLTAIAQTLPAKKSSRS
jgi:NTE family protein